MFCVMKHYDDDIYSEKIILVLGGSTYARDSYGWVGMRFAIMLSSSGPGPSPISISKLKKEPELTL